MDHVLTRLELEENGFCEIADGFVEVRVVPLIIKPYVAIVSLYRQTSEKSWAKRI